MSILPGSKQLPFIFVKAANVLDICHDSSSFRSSLAAIRVAVTLPGVHRCFCCKVTLLALS